MIPVDVIPVDFVGTFLVQLLFIFKQKCYMLNVKYENITFHIADVLIWLIYRLLMFSPPH